MIVHIFPHSPLDSFNIAICRRRNFGSFFHRIIRIIKRFPNFSSSMSEAGNRINRENKKKPLMRLFFWCSRRDLNPYPLGHAPQTCAYASSATTAQYGLMSTSSNYLYIIHGFSIFVNTFFHIFIFKSLHHHLILTDLRTQQSSLWQ